MKKINKYKMVTTCHETIVSIPRDLDSIGTSLPPSIRKPEVTNTSGGLLGTL